MRGESNPSVNTKSNSISLEVENHATQTPVKSYIRKKKGRTSVFSHLFPDFDKVTEDQVGGITKKKKKVEYIKVNPLKGEHKKGKVVYISAFVGL